MRGAHSCEETHKRHSAELTAAKWDSQSLLNGILKKTSILPRKWEFDKMGMFDHQTPQKLSNEAGFNKKSLALI